MSRLFLYGGRPVIYTDEITLHHLPPELQYLWVFYEPTAIWNSDREGYPIDWTHEREWRCCPNEVINTAIGITENTNAVVPLNLPLRDNSNPDSPYFVIIVDTEKRKAELYNWIEQTVPQLKDKDGYWTHYSIALNLAKNLILSFEAIEGSEKHLGRIEDFLRIT